MWPNRKLIELLGIEVPIIQAPMAGASGSAMAAAVSVAGGLGSLPCAMLSADKIRAELGAIRQHTTYPVNLNFFCHTLLRPDPKQEAAWQARLAVYYEELALDMSLRPPAAVRAPFDEARCEVIEELNPEVVSFHFGLPEPSLLSRVKAAKCLVMSSATTVAEARWLEAHGCDVIIAQGYEAGGHRGMFLTDDPLSQVGTLALVPQVVDAVSVPVIAAGGIADGRGIAAAFALGASGVQLGTAYLFTPEALISTLHRSALHAASDESAIAGPNSSIGCRSSLNAIEAVVIRLVLDQRRTRQKVEILHAPGRNVLLQAFDQGQVFLDGRRNTAIAKFEKEFGQHR